MACRHIEEYVCRLSAQVALCPTPQTLTHRARCPLCMHPTRIPHSLRTAPIAAPPCLRSCSARTVGLTPSSDPSPPVHAQLPQTHLHVPNQAQVVLTNPHSPAHSPMAVPASRHSPIHVWFVRVDLHMRELALSNGHDHAQLLLAQHHLLIIVLVINGAHCLRHATMVCLAHCTRSSHRAWCALREPTALTTLQRRVWREAGLGHAHRVCGGCCGARGVREGAAWATTCTGSKAWASTQWRCARPPCNAHTIHPAPVEPRPTGKTHEVTVDSCVHCAKELGQLCLRVQNTILLPWL